MRPPVPSVSTRYVATKSQVSISAIYLIAFFDILESLMFVEYLARAKIKIKLIVSLYCNHF